MDLNQAWQQVGVLIAAVIVFVEAARTIPWVKAILKAFSWSIYVLVVGAAIVIGMFNTLNEIFMNLTPRVQQGIITLMVVVGALGAVAFVHRVADRGKNGGNGANGKVGTPPAA